MEDVNPETIELLLEITLGDPPDYCAVITSRRLHIKLSAMWRFKILRMG